MKKLYILLTITFLSTTTFAGDILFLNDSVSYEGKVKSISDCTIEFKFDKQVYSIPTSDFALIRLEKNKGKTYRKFQKMATDTFSMADEETCIKAQEDAQALHYTGWNKYFNIVYGMVLPGVSELLGAIYIKPNFSDARFMDLSPNKDLHNDAKYLKCYLKRAKNERQSMRFFGTGLTVISFLAAITLL